MTPIEYFCIGLVVGACLGFTLGLAAGLWQWFINENKRKLNNIWKGHQ